MTCTIYTNYVAGLMFNSDFTRVALIRKNKPEWQAGKLNGIGGKVEAGECADEAMCREFIEETGSTAGLWKRFLLLDGTGFSVLFFWTVGDLDSLRSMEDEEVEIAEVNTLTPDRADIIDNIAWIVALAIDSAADDRPAFTTAQYL